MQDVSTATSVTLCPTILIDQPPPPAEGVLSVASSPFVVATRPAFVDSCCNEKTNNVCAAGQATGEKREKKSKKNLSAPELILFRLRGRRHSSSDITAATTVSNAASSSSTLSTSPTTGQSSSSLVPMFPSRRLSSAEAFTSSYLRHNHRPRSATTLSASNVFKKSKSNTVLDERDYGSLLSHSTSMYQQSGEDRSRENSDQTIATAKPARSRKYSNSKREVPPPANPAAASAKQECATAENVSIIFTDYSIPEPAPGFADSCNTNRDLIPTMPPTNFEASLSITAHQKTDSYTDVGCNDLIDKQCLTISHNTDIDSTIADGHVDDENKTNSVGQRNKKRTLSLSVPSTKELFKNPTRSLTENFANLRNRLQGFNSEGATPTYTSRHVSQLNVNTQPKFRQIRHSHTSSNFQGCYVIQSSKCSFLFSSTAKYPSLPMVTCKCIIAADTEKHGKAIFEKLKTIKSKVQKDAGNGSVEASMGDVIGEVVYDSTSLSFMRAVTTRVMKLSDAVDFMDVLEPSVNNVLFFSFLGCYGHNLNFVPGKRNLEKLLLQLEIPYADDEFDDRDSRRVLYNLVVLRKLKLLREFVKYVQWALPSHTLSLMLVLPLHLNDTYHYNSRSISNGELLHDLALNVIIPLQKTMGKRCEILFVDSRAKNDFIVDKIMQVLSSDASKDNESPENAKSAADVGYIRASLPVICQMGLTPSTALC